MDGEVIPIGRNWIRDLEVTDEILEKLWSKHRVVLDEVIECLLGYTIRRVKPGDSGRLYVYGRSEGTIFVNSFGTACSKEFLPPFCSEYDTRRGKKIWQNA